jgi:nucleotide-binding universal stress UspA family protein
MRRAAGPVLAVRPDAEIHHPYRRVLVPTDGSECADAALETAIDVANAYSAPLHVLSVVDVVSLGADVYSTVQIDDLEAQATREVDTAVEVAERASVEAVGAVERGTAVHRTICEYAGDQGIDLVVMGTHGRTGIDRHLLGSVAEQTVRTASIPVLTVPASPSGPE